jgi:hypothetical protein
VNRLSGFLNCGPSEDKPAGGEADGFASPVIGLKPDAVKKVLDIRGADLENLGVLESCRTSSAPRK